MTAKHPHTCPLCGGTGKLDGLGTSNHKMVFVSANCPLCAGVGMISATRMAQVKQGRAARDRRIAAGEVVSRMARRLGVRPSLLCSMEMGLVKLKADYYAAFPPKRAA